MIKIFNQLSVSELFTYFYYTNSASTDANFCVVHTASTDRFDVYHHAESRALVGKDNLFKVNGHFKEFVNSKILSSQDMCLED